MKQYKKRVYKKKAPKKTNKVSKTISKAVHKVLNKDAETKYTSLYSQNQTLNYSTTATSTPTYSLMPLVQQAINEGGRIGNQITTTKVLFKYRLYTLNSASVFPTRYVRVLIVRQRTAPQTNPSTNLATLFRAGASGLTTEPQRNDLDMLFKINTCDFSVMYDKIHKIGTSTHSTSLSLNNNDFHQSEIHAVNLQRHYGKLIYNDGLQPPQNKNFWVFFLCAPAAGDTGTSAADTGIRMTYSCEMHYKDV